MRLSYADLDLLPAYIEQDLIMLNDALREQETPAGQLTEKNAREYARRITETKAE